MKLRIEGNVLRLRLTQKEVDCLRDRKFVECAIRFGHGRALHYSVISTNAADVSVNYDGDSIRVVLPFSAATAWVESSQVTLEGPRNRNSGIRILVEKDFQCLHKLPGRDPDAYPHPLLVDSDEGKLKSTKSSTSNPNSKLSLMHALEKGDFAYPLNVQSHDELGEVTAAAFYNMRKSLHESQQNLLKAERLATIGSMATSISHDLRHPLAAILAYAEILTESEIDKNERKELYDEIRFSVKKMTESIGSLLEFSKARGGLQLGYGDVADILQHTIGAFQIRPEYSAPQITLRHEGSTQGWFDFNKLDRAFQNILQNACEAVSPDKGKIEVLAARVHDRVEILVTDNGSGIPEAIRDEIFEPFVTHGKAGGIGLGLSVVQNIIRDHGGDVKLESTGSKGTTFKLTLPVMPVAAQLTPQPFSSLNIIRTL